MMRKYEPVTILADRPVDPTPNDDVERPGNATAKHHNVSLLSVATRAMVWKPGG